MTNPAKNYRMKNDFINLLKQYGCSIFTVYQREHMCIQKYVTLYESGKIERKYTDVHEDDRENHEFRPLFLTALHFNRSYQSAKVVSTSGKTESSSLAADCISYNKKRPEHYHYVWNRILTLILAEYLRWRWTWKESNKKSINLIHSNGSCDEWHYTIL